MNQSTQFPIMPNTSSRVDNPVQRVRFFVINALQECETRLVYKFPLKLP